MLYGKATYGISKYKSKPAEAWIEPVWQRTQPDVAYAVYLNNKIIQSGWESLTSLEQEAWRWELIGCLNYWDLVRIERNTGYLSDMLNSHMYCQTITSKTDWQKTNFPYASEMERIRSNIQALIDAFHAQSVALPASLAKPNYKTINAVENVLRLMKEMIHRMEASIRPAGTFYAGEGNL